MRCVKYILLIMTLISLIALVGCASEPEKCEIISANLVKSGESVTLKATLTDSYIQEHKGGKVYLIALDSSYDQEITSGEVLGSSRLRNNLSFKFELETDLGKSLLSSAFVVARMEGDGGKYVAVTEAEFISNPEILATNGRRVADSKSLKGLCSSDVYSAEMLGAEHIVFEVELEKLLLPTYEEGAVNHIYNDRSYYYNAEELYRLDKQVEEATRLGLRIYIRTVLKYPTVDEQGNYAYEPIPALYCPNVGFFESSYLPNIENESAAGYLCAVYDLFASRYSGEGGLVLDYIIGKDANSMACGSYDSARAMDNYLSWVRSAYNILASKSKNVTVYVSVDNHLQGKEGSADTGMKVFLNNFAAKAKSSGDFSWQISLSLGKGDDLSEILANNSKNYARLGVNDLANLQEFLSQEGMKYTEENRRVILDLSLSNQISEANRAAYYTYTYYTAAEAGYSALIYCTDSEESSLYNASGARTEFYYSILMSGSNTATQLQDFIQKIPAAKDLNLKDHALCYLTYEQQIVTEVGRAVANNKKSFPGLLSDFASAAGVTNMNLSQDLETGAQTLTVEGYVNEEYMAISCYEIEASELFESGYVGITMSSPTTAKIALIISDKDLAEGKSAVYVGEAKVLASSATYYFNISPFTDKVKRSDKLCLSLVVLPDENISSAGNAILEIDEIALYGTSGNGVRTVLSVITVAISTLGICALLYLLTQRRKKVIKRETEE